MESWWLTHGERLKGGRGFAAKLPAGAVCGAWEGTDRVGLGELPRILSWATAKLRRVLVTWELLHLAKHWVWVQEPRCCPEYPSPTTVVGVAQTQASANRAAGHTGLSGCLLLPAFLWFLFQVLGHELHLLLLECLQRLKFQSG